MNSIRGGEKNSANLNNGFNQIFRVFIQSNVIFIRMNLLFFSRYEIIDF